MLRSGGSEEVSPGSWASAAWGLGCGICKISEGTAIGIGVLEGCEVKCGEVSDARIRGFGMARCENMHNF